MKSAESNLLSAALLELSIQAQDLERKVTTLSQLEELKSKISEKDELIERLKLKISQIEATNLDLENKLSNANQSTNGSTNIPIPSVDYPEYVVYNLLDKLYLHVPDWQISTFSSEINRLLTLNPGLADHPTVISVLQGSVIQDALVLIDRLEDETDCTEIESQLSNFSNQRTLLANRLCLFLILKNMHLTNIYKILFTSLFYENSRIVAIIKDALFAKMLDLQLLSDNSDFKHPILWAFGPNYLTKKALNYLHSLLFNVTKVPSDPVTGDNIWHYIAKDRSEDIVTNIKNCNIHTEALEACNKQGITPLQLVPPDTHHDISQCLIMNIASDGAEYYKSGDYDKALELYSKALDKQIALSCEYTDKLSDKDKSSHNTNIGKLLYNKARSLMHLRRWSESITTCELCIAYLPRYGNAYETIIQAADSLLDWEKGLDVCIEYQVACGVDLRERREFFNAQLNATAFQILQIPINSSQKTIKQSFNNLCKVWHPDKIHDDDDLKRRSTFHFNRLFNARQLLMDDDTRLIEMGKLETNYICPNPIFKPNDDRSFTVDKFSKLHFEVMMQTQSVGLLEMAGKRMGDEIDKANLILSNLQSKLLETANNTSGRNTDDNYVERMRFMDNIMNTHNKTTNDDSMYRVESNYNDDENFPTPNFPPNFQGVQSFASSNPQSSNVFGRYAKNVPTTSSFWRASSIKDSWLSGVNGSGGGGSKMRDSSMARIKEPDTARIRTSSTSRAREYSSARNMSRSATGGKDARMPTSKIRPLGFRIYSAAEG
ncbi:conserved Plasmodium protein, unknown function [Babesia microti strain RI]|uniref:J domain-containing protein n=1 Tax=Babesia microti (strain RI) TaxID=1133968 RepID=A0A1R4AAT1_BABMR|nr:conserved Plasmodium protein, unknown function [Babesia microti strain RI]SJK86095.1 conserved Plasmodium protein, unknown function [Babesia microti strain RI]|eukprot:XP_021338291.1 conserved Plasmodium protein, unknown function [Babesia microti strain RI]